MSWQAIVVPAPTVAPTLDVTVLVATRNRARRLAAMLAHLARQRVDGFTWEIIIVDNGSSDDTEQVLAYAAPRLPLTVMREPVPGKNRALNRALPHASGRLLVFTDDDVEQDTSWLFELVAAARRWPACAIVGGVVLPAFPEGAPEWMTAHPFARHAFARFQLDAEESQLPPEEIPFGGNLAVQARALAHMRFDERIGPQGRHYASGSEAGLLLRLVSRGERAVYAPRAIVRHMIEPHQLRFRWLFGRAFRLGRGQARLLPDRGEVRLLGVPRYLWRQFAEASARWVVSIPMGAAAHFDAGVEWCRVCGQIYEHRRLAAELRSEG